MSNTPNYLVDWKSILEKFPVGQTPPSLLREFSLWIKNLEWGSMGCFDILGQSSEEAPLPYDAYLLRDEFALFMRLPDGSRIGFWILENSKVQLNTRSEQPIILLGSEGQLKILANSFESFLARIALNLFEHVEEDLMVHEDSQSALDLLNEWLKEKLSVPDLQNLIEPVLLDSNFKTYISKWMDERKTYWEHHPITKKMSIILSGYKLPSADLWDSTLFKAVFSKDSFSFQVLSRGWKDIPESTAIKQLLLELRNQQLKANPTWNLWTVAEFLLYGDGRLYPRFYFKGETET